MYVLKFTRTEIHRKEWSAGLFPNDKFLGLYPATFIRDCLTHSLFYFSLPFSPLRWFFTVSRASCVTGNVIFRRANSRAKWNTLKQIPSSQVGSHFSHWRALMEKLNLFLPRIFVEEKDYCKFKQVANVYILRNAWMILFSERTALHSKYTNCNRTLTFEIVARYFRACTIS